METIIDVEFGEDLIMENTRLRMLVKELAECISNNPCTGCEMYCCGTCKHRRKMNALVERAREEVKDGE